MRLSKLSVFVIALTFALACRSAAHAQAVPDLNQAGLLGTELFTASGSTGMVLVVVRDNQVFFRGYGEISPGSGVHPAENSVLRLCSLSKIFATDLLTQLVEDKTVALNDPLQLFAPPHVTVPLRAGKAITLEDLATHTASLPRELAAAPHDTPHFTFPGYTTRWHWLPNQRLRSVPGTAALYSNIGFDLLGDALAKASGKPYAQLFAERITTPLGMHETGFTPNINQCQRLLQGTHDQGPCTDTQSSAASAGVYSTATDMSVWLKYLLGTGAPAIPAQSPAAQAVYLQPADLVSQQGLDHAGTPTGIGLGWIHLLPTDSTSTIVEKTGGGAGFLTYIALNHAHRTGLFVAMTDGATETHVNISKQANDLLLALVGEPPLPPEPPKKQIVRPRRRPAHRRARP